MTKNPLKNTELLDASSEVKSDFILERYKYILQQVQFLNESIQKYLALFQTLATAIVGGGITILVSWQSLKISADVARIGVQGLLGLLILLALFVVIMLIASIFSWFDYRHEEVDLLNQVVRPGFRRLPSVRNLWRWQETYLILFIVVMAIAIVVFTEQQIIPMIK